MVDVKKKITRKRKPAVKKDESIYSLKTRWEGRHIRVCREKGQVPDALSGLYSDEASAQRAIKLFYTQRIR